MAYNKYYLQKRQVSYDNGLTWEDVTPSETRQGAFIDSYETLSDCEGVIDYSKQYLTFVAEADGLSISNNSSNTFLYSTNGGENWSPLFGNQETDMVYSGETIMLKGTNPTVGNGIGSLTPNATARVEGNIMSLIYGDDFVGQTVIPNNTEFYGLFLGCHNLTSAENLILPATTLTVACYGEMFNNCYNLTTAPELPATTLVPGCYYRMFQNCSNLNYIKCLATDISADSCLSIWVAFVSSTGTFVKNAAMNDWPTGSSGIPNGWTVIDNS